MPANGHCSFLHIGFNRNWPFVDDHVTVETRTTPNFDHVREDDDERLVLHRY